MKPTKYVQEAIIKWAVHLLTHYAGKYRTPKKAESPLKMGYDPEFDTILELEQMQHHII